MATHSEPSTAAARTRWSSRPWNVLGTVVILLLSMLSYAVVSATPATAAVADPAWTMGPPASPRYSAGVAYHESAGQIVLFGGLSPGSGYLADTWTGDGTTWTAQSPATAPSPRQNPSMAYDAANGQVVLFGGYYWDGTTRHYYGDTWTWDGTTWTQRFPATSPPGRFNAGMAYDSTRHQIVMFGGHDANLYLNDTWIWNGTTWTQRFPATSAPRRSAPLAYDAANQEVVLFGGQGYDTGGGYGQDTWVWNGSTWAQRFPAHVPPRRYMASLAYDAANEQIVLFGGQDAYYLGDTWTWDGTDWTERSATTPGARGFPALAYVTTAGKIFLFGGVGGGGVLGDTWAWNGTTWTQQYLAPSARNMQAMAYDAARDEVVLFGGSSLAGTLGDTWTWDGTHWTKQTPAHSPPPTYAAALAYDASNSEVVLFGGIGGGESGQTWTWDGTDWTQQSPTHSPVGRLGPALAYDAGQGEVVLFGGFRADGILTDTWTWDGTDWTQQSPAHSPSARSSAGFAYDAEQAQIVLFGGHTNSSNLGDTWTWDGTDWTQQSPASSPSARYGAAMAYDSVARRVILFGGGTNGSSHLGDTWTWNGTTWTQQSPATAPSARQGTAMAYHAGSGKSVLFGGFGGAGYFYGDTWFFTSGSIATTITVTVSGSQAFGSNSPTFNANSDAPNGVTVDTTALVCATVDAGTTIDAALAAGNHTIDGTSCTGATVDNTNYTLDYVGATDGFVVSEATITVTASGSQTYGSSSPDFNADSDAPDGVTVDTTALVCTTVDTGTTINAALAAGNHTIDGTSCTGATVDNTNYTLQYQGATDGFVVNPATITVTASGTQTYGSSSPVFNANSDAPDGVTVNTNALTCTTVDTGTTIDNTLSVDSYTIDGSSCTGATVDNTNYTLQYQGATDGFVVSLATITVSVSGSQTYGSNSPVFNANSDAPDGVTVNTTALVCTTVDTGTTINAALAAGNHTIDGTSCTGATVDNTNYTLQYQGATDGFVVNPATITVTASGSQTYGSNSPVFNANSDAPDGVTVKTTALVCTTVDTGTTINAALAAGGHTIDGSSCTGATVDNTNYTLGYVGATNGFVVNPATITVTASGSQTFGSHSPVFNADSDAPDGVTVNTTALVCTTVDTGTTIDNTLAVGSYTIDGTSCTGATVDNTNYTLQYQGATDGFIVNPDTITVTVRVSGSQVFGSSDPAFHKTDNSPAGVTLNGTLVCTTVDGGTTIDAALGAGTHTIDSASCSGLTASASGYSIEYQGVVDGFVVSQVSTSMLYNGDQLVTAGTSLHLGAALSSSASACEVGQPVQFSLDGDPTGGSTVPYILGSWSTGPGGSVSHTLSTTGWTSGVYTVTATFAGTTSCGTSSDEATLTVASPGDAANGGGWYTVAGSGRVNFGFTVHKVKHSDTYTGQVLLINNSRWRLKGTLTNYVSTGSGQGAVTGTGTLYWWNTALNDGQGGWQIARSNVAFTVSFTETTGGKGRGKKAGSPGSFGIHIDYTPVSEQPSSLPNSPPVELKGGQIRVS